MTSLIIVGLICAILGLIGCLMPVIPGPPLSLVALIVLSYAKNWEPFSLTFFIVMALIVIVLMILEYVVPLISAKKFGASHKGIMGSIIGMLAGLFFFPPWGIFIGAFIGAVLGEIIAGKDSYKAIQVGWGIFLGNIATVGLKLAFTGITLFLYIKEMF